MHDLVIDGLGAKGEGVGRLPDGQVVFVPAALPGDRVRVRLGERRRQVQQAELVELLEPSADRVESRCPVERCGGCALRSLSLAAQARHKRLRVVEVLRRIGKIDAADKVGEVQQVGDGWRYRHRVRLHATAAAGGFAIGFFAAGSHTLVPLQGCAVLWRELDQAAAIAARELGKLPAKADLDGVELCCSRRDDRVAARLVGRGDTAEYRRAPVWIAASGLAGVDVASGGKRWQQGNLELRYDHDRVELFDLQFEPAVFTQANPAVNDRLRDAVLRAVKPQAGLRLLELCAGIGNLTVPLGLAGATVLASELDRRAAILCQRNATRAGVTAQVLALDADRAAGRADEFDLVLLDPPRTGARSACQLLAGRGPARLVYVSCDAATFARDAALLVAGGYRLDGVELLDMFPQTPHVELVASLSRP